MPTISPISPITASDMSLSQILLYPVRSCDLWTGETGQVRYRFFAATVVLAGYLIAHWSQRYGDLSKALAAITAYATFAYGWGVVVVMNVGRTIHRRLLGIVLDHGIFAACLFYAANEFAALLWVTGSITTGTALRFGPRLGAFSLGVGGVSLSLAMMLSDYWRSIPAVSFGIIVAEVVLPLYALLLSARLRKAKQEAEALAVALDADRQTDALTGIANRIGLSVAIDRLAAHDNAPLAHVFYVDLDGFKAVNDLAGHGAGDAVLKDAASAMKAVVRSCDVVARVGGDEFVVVVAGDSAHPLSVTKITDKLAAAVAAIKVPGHPSLLVRASIGVCQFEGKDAASFRSAIGSADVEMLRNKQEVKRVRLEEADRSPA